MSAWTLWVDCGQENNLHGSYDCFEMSEYDYLSASVSPYRPAVPNTIKLLKSAERRTFCYVAHRMWNELHHKIRESTSVPQFKKAKKTYLF